MLCVIYSAGRDIRTRTNGLDVFQIYEPRLQITSKPDKCGVDDTKCTKASSFTWGFFWNGPCNAKDGGREHKPRYICLKNSIPGSCCRWAVDQRGSMIGFIYAICS